MVFSPLGPGMELVWDIVAMVISILAVMLVVLINGAIQKGGKLSSDVTRKIVHIFAGPVFLVTWPLYTGGLLSRVIAAVVPILFVLLFVGIGTGKVKNEAFVASMSRSGKPEELLKGTLYYAIWIVIITLLWFYVPPAGLASASPLALIIIGCVAGGDGMADIVGRKYGGERKFGIGGAQKTVAGSFGMLIGSLVFCSALVLIFSLEAGFSLIAMFPVILIISIVATLVEALSPSSLDNWTVPISVVIVAAVLSSVTMWSFPLLTL
ncbi:MAG: hypothetical protein HXY34_02540 [Candidatus Thorarchaeota archaeon]|nr:hypothetical protein [Candidatus Thorarchaeota archaeon]